MAAGLLMSRPDQWSASSPLNLVHSYVNVVERSDSEEPKPALPARNSKTRSKSGQRSSRSRERKEREARSDYEKIKERESKLGNKSLERQKQAILIQEQALKA